MDASLNYSVGFRAPAQKDLLTGLADYLIENDLQGIRYTDPNRQLNSNIGAITSEDLQQVRSLLQGLIDDPKLLASYFGSYITHAKHDLDATEPDPHYNADEIAEYLEEGSVLARLGGLRVCYIQAHEDSDIQLFINGMTIVLPASAKRTVVQLSEHTVLDQAMAAEFAHDPAKLQLLTQLINLGYWYFIE